MYNISNVVLSNVCPAIPHAPEAIQHIAETASSNVTEVATVIFNGVAQASEADSSFSWLNLVFVAGVLCYGYSLCEPVVRSFFHSMNPSSAEQSMDDFSELEDFDLDLDDEELQEGEFDRIEGNASALISTPNDLLDHYYLEAEILRAERKNQRRLGNLEQAAQLNRRLDDVKDRINVLRSLIPGRVPGASVPANVGVSPLAAERVSQVRPNDQEEKAAPSVKRVMSLMALAAGALFFVTQLAASATSVEPLAIG